MDPIQEIISGIKEVIDQNKEALFEKDLRWIELSDAYKEIISELRKELIWSLADRGFKDTQIHKKTGINYQTVTMLTKEYWENRMENKKDGFKIP